MSDPAVVAAVYATAKSMGASDKVMLALFEACLVESNFTNPTGGDRDSVGVLQQRPSQGWPNPHDIPTATRSFVTRAMAKQDLYSTAGQLAQAVQISAFPLRYDARESEAKALLAAQGSGTSSTTALTEMSDTTSTTAAGINWAVVERFALGMVGAALFFVGVMSLRKKES